MIHQIPPHGVNAKKDKVMEKELEYTRFTVRGGELQLEDSAPRQKERTPVDRIMFHNNTSK